jgi:penicillin-binding protein-related factor A (putative recombinase)
VQASFSKSPDNPRGEWRPIQSYPDFEGVLMGGRQFIIEAKVCNAASFPLDDDKFKARQYRHLTRRAKFGAISLIVLHFPVRQLKKSLTPALTVAIPVHPDLPLWEAFDRGEVKRITRTDCELHGLEVLWTIPDRCRRPVPDILAAIERVADDRSASPSTRG